MGPGGTHSGYFLVQCSPEPLTLLPAVTRWDRPGHRGRKWFQTGREDPGGGVRVGTGPFLPPSWELTPVPLETHANPCLALISTQALTGSNCVDGRALMRQRRTLTLPSLLPTINMFTLSKLINDQYSLIHLWFTPAERIFMSNFKQFKILQ